MAIIKNPNEIVAQLVDDYKLALCENLLSAVLYGSAVTHEYRPGISDINSILVLRTDAIENLAKCLPVSCKWQKRKVAVPFFMTPDFIAAAVEWYPVEFLDIQTGYRVLFGEDYFSHLEIDREKLRGQCERELLDVSVNVRREFVGGGGKGPMLEALAAASMKKLLPVFKALLRLHTLPVPKIRSDVVMAIEDLFGLGASALSGVLAKENQGKRSPMTLGLFENFSATIDLIIARVREHPQDAIQP
jgi:hypothetical protein